VPVVGHHVQERRLAALQLASHELQHPPAREAPAALRGMRAHAADLAVAAHLQALAGRRDQDAGFEHAEILAELGRARAERFRPREPRQRDRLRHVARLEPDRLERQKRSPGAQCAAGASRSGERGSANPAIAEKPRA